MIGEDGRIRFVELYEDTCRIILDMETECLRHNTALSKSERDMLKKANEFKNAVFEMLIRDINTKDPYND